MRSLSACVCGDVVRRENMVPSTPQLLVMFMCHRSCQHTDEGA